MKRFQDNKSPVAFISTLNMIMSWMTENLPHHLNNFFLMSHEIMQRTWRSLVAINKLLTLSDCFCFVCFLQIPVTQHLIRGEAEDLEVVRPILCVLSQYPLCLQHNSTAFLDLKVSPQRLSPDYQNGFLANTNTYSGCVQSALVYSERRWDYHKSGIINMFNCLGPILQHVWCLPETN